MNTVEKFWLKVNRLNESDCWNWVGPIEEQGYGVFGWNGKKIKAHRLSWVLTKGEIPKGLFVCHTCDNRKCVNPKHLWLGTVQDNNRDRDLKGRNGWGGNPWQLNPNVKLNPDSVRDIKEKWLSGMDYQEIGDIYNLSKHTIRKVINGQRWSNSKTGHKLVRVAA